MAQNSPPQPEGPGNTSTPTALVAAAGHPVASLCLTADSIALSFSGFGLQGVGDESWGLDNVKLEAFAEEPNKDITGRQLQGLWKDLAGDDPIKAFEAIWQLVGAGDKAVELLNQQLDQVGANGEKPVTKLILFKRIYPARRRTQKQSPRPYR